MNHFNAQANEWDTSEKIERSKKYADQIQMKLNGKKPHAVLELGCGTGLLGSHFISESSSLLGIDTSVGMLEVFNSKFKNSLNVKSMNLNLEESNFPIDQKFDLIISSMAFHHLKNPEEMILKLKKLLNHSGILAVIDLDLEPGNFHPDPKSMGVCHFGFSNKTLEQWGSNANFSRTSISIIDSIKKETGDFPIFLATYFM